MENILYTFFIIGLAQWSFGYQNVKRRIFFLTSDDENFITLDNKNFKVR